MSKQYFARIDGEQRGPFTLDQLAEACVTPDTYVWCKGMDDWTKARHDADICRAFRQRLFDKMHPGDTPAENEPLKDTDPENLESVPLRFRRYVEKDGSPVGEPVKDTPDVDQQPRSLMIEAIVVTICCSMLLGIGAIYFSYKAQKEWRAGHKEQAHELTRRAKMWIGISFFVGIILNVSYLYMKFGH